MSRIYIPCLNVDAPDEGIDFGVGVIPTSGPEGEIGIVPGVTISHPDSPFTLTVSPFGPVLMIGINWKWWADLFGLGETRIEREKEQIQDVLTPIFRFLKKGYGFPLRDNHALQFSSDRVEQYMRERPDFDALRERMYVEAMPLAQSVFVDDTPSTGQRKRIVNQFLANAADNQWPLDATQWVWYAMLDAAKPACRNEKGRWLKNPMLMDSVAKYSVLLRYMPLANFASAVAQQKFNDPDGRKLVRHWLQNPQLVAGIPQVLEIPPWAVAYKSPEDGGGQSGNPYETQQIADRKPIQDLWAGVQFPRPQYPYLFYETQGGLITPEAVISPPQKPPDWDQQPDNPPWPGDNVVEIPPVQPGPQNWPQYPDCPPWNQQPQPGEEPGPQPEPEPGEQEPDDQCDPDCQIQIDYLKERVQYIDNWLVLGIIPRIDNLEDWLLDLERRVPGPLPPLPNPAPFPPWLPPEEIPTDPGDEPTGPTGEGNPCDFDALDCEELEKWIDPDKRCKEIAKCDRELECVDLTLCDEAGGPWGGMAECWLDKNTPNPPDLQGVFLTREYPQYAAQSLVFAYTSALQRLGGGPVGQGGQLPPVSAQSPQAELSRYTAVYVPKLLEAYTGAAIQAEGAEEIVFDPVTYIYEDPAGAADTKAHIITVKPRPGEIDPCTGVAEEVLEIPPVEVQP